MSHGQFADLDTLSAIFHHELGREPDGVWSAPGRVNLIGEHTDYNGGFVLPFAIDRKTLVAAAKRADGVLTARSRQRLGEHVNVRISDLRPGAVAGWAGYVAGTVWALREAGHDIGGVDLFIDSDVPVGAGLSSSAALECAVGLAALETHGIDLPRDRLARIAQRAENEFVGVPCGLMDQMAASACKAGHALFFDVRDNVAVHEPFDPGSDGLALLVVDTRARHALADGEYALRRRDCEHAAASLGVESLRDISVAELDAVLFRLDDETTRKRTRHVVTENARVLETVERLRAGKARDIGNLLTESHVSLRDDFEVSSPELDAAVDAALRAGALGARMTGGGFGGSAIVLIDSNDVVPVSQAITHAFRELGLASPDIMCPRVAPGARRES